MGTDDLLLETVVAGAHDRRDAYAVVQGRALVRQASALVDGELSHQCPNKPVLPLLRHFQSPPSATTPRLPVPMAVAVFDGYRLRYVREFPRKFPYRKVPQI